MKMIVALIGSVFIFIATWFLSSMLVAMLWEYSRTVISVGSLTTNIAVLIGLVAASLAATHTFRASLHSKTGKLSKKEEAEKPEN